MLDVVDYPELPQKARILKIAAQLFAKRGFHAVGMSDLQEAVKLGRGALYHHIGSKEDLLYEISSEYIQDLARSAALLAMNVRDPSERIGCLGSDLVQKIFTHRCELTVCFREIQSLTEPRLSEVLGFHGQYERVWRETMVDGADLGQFRPYDSVNLKAVLGMYFYGYLWMTPSRSVGPEVIAERLNEMSLRMLRAG